MYKNLFLFNFVHTSVESTRNFCDIGYILVKKNVMVNPTLQ